MKLTRILTNRFHGLTEPILAAAGKRRLPDFGLKASVRPPAADVRFEGSCGCEQPLCAALVADARRFHRRNMPRDGLERWFVPTPMLLDLSRFPSTADYIRAISRVSHGKSIRSANRARRLGVTCAPIRPESYLGSIAEISRSKRVRSGGPVLAAWAPPREAVGDTLEPPAPPACPEHWTLAWGAFIPTDEGPRLIAHLSLRRTGDLCRTFEFMGHGDYLRTGAVRLLLLDVVGWLLERTAPEAQGVRWFMYGSMEHGGHGLSEWKRRMGFEPANLTFEPERPSGPASS